MNSENCGDKPWMLSAHVESLALDEANVWKSGTALGLHQGLVPKAHTNGLQKIIQRVDQVYSSANGNTKKPFSTAITSPPVTSHQHGPKRTAWGTGHPLISDGWGGDRIQLKRVQDTPTR